MALDETTSPNAPLDTTMSRDIGKLALALAKAQHEIKNPTKDKAVSGRAYEFRYASLDAVIDAIRGPLAKNELAVTGGLVLHEKSKGPAYETRLVHSSGQWMKSVAQLMIAEQTSAALGSSITYMRRYQICAMLNICADEDDDGSMASGENPHSGAQKEFSASRSIRGAATGKLVDPHFEATKREDWDNTPPPSALTLPPFGLYKGEPIHSVPLEGLEWYVQAVERSINDPAKGQYREKNEALLNALDAQIQHLNASSSGDSFEMAVQALRADEAVSQLLNDWGLLTMADVPIDRQSEFISMLKDLMKAQAKAKKKKPS